MKHFLVPGSILLAGLAIGTGLFLGLKKPDLPQEKALGVAEIPPEVAKIVTTSIDNDAILGDKSRAKIAIVEFSDYECPFCNRFKQETLPQIKENYLDTGKAILVFRDLPLSFHNPAAEQEAMAAECARDQGGDQIYYQYHDQIFETTPGNGQGITLDEMGKIAQELGLDANQLKKCVESNQFKDEVNRDAADAAQIGINGTPGFVVGKLDSDGRVEGEVISGAQPYAVFQSAIEKLLE